MTDLVETFKTLPRPEQARALADMLEHAAVKPSWIAEDLRSVAKTLEKVFEKAIAVKAYASGQVSATGRMKSGAG